MKWVFPQSWIWPAFRQWLTTSALWVSLSETPWDYLNSCFKHNCFTVMSGKCSVALLGQNNQDSITTTFHTTFHCLIYTMYIHVDIHQNTSMLHCPLSVQINTMYVKYVCYWSCNGQLSPTTLKLSYTWLGHVSLNIKSVKKTKTFEFDIFCHFWINTNVGQTQHVHV